MAAKLATTTQKKVLQRTSYVTEFVFEAIAFSVANRDVLLKFPILSF